MYKISIPTTTFVCDNYDRNELAQKMKAVGAERVFICPKSGTLDKEKRKIELESIKRHCEFFHKEGFEVGIWVWTLQDKSNPDIVHMTNADGEADIITVCPTDDTFSDMMADFVEDAAKTGVDIIMFDDDFRFGFHGIGFGCCCKNHLKMISEKLGEEVNLPLMKEKLLSGGKNKYRDAFIECNGISLENFAIKMREHLDKINPDIRMGACSCITNWDIDGTTPDRYAKLFAGKTKPFYRLIGAPYWAGFVHYAWGNRLADVIELERLESERRTDKDIEIFGEGDSYPRPRFNTPAAYLEGFDLGLRVAGCTDGILWYGMDYRSSPSYETGYMKAHLRNLPIKKEIAEVFDNKKSVGVRVYDKTPKYADTLIPKIIENQYAPQDYAFNAGARLAAACSLPIVYNGDGTGAIAIGEDVNAVPDDKLSGLVIDIRAAEILNDRGIDVGIEAIGDYIEANAEEYKNGEYVSFKSTAKVREVKVKPNAIIESEFPIEDVYYPASYRYTNSQGQKFLVLCFEGYFILDSLFRQYTRASQLAAALEWMTGKTIPVKCFGNPDLYIQAKEGEGKTAAALFNFIEDEIYDADVIFASEVKSVKTINCNATIHDNIVTVDYIKPFGFAGLEVEFY